MWNSALSILLLGLPVVLSHVWKSAMAVLGPWASPTTVPCGVFFTQPTKPKPCAVACVCLRKYTPWTCEGRMHGEHPVRL